MHPDLHAATDLRELAYGEHLLLWSFRALGTDQYDRPIVLRTHARALGHHSPNARRAIQTFAGQLQDQGRRAIALGQPGRLSLTRDERSLLAVFAAAQRGERDRCLAHLACLLAGPASLSAYATVLEILQILDATGHRPGRDGLAPRTPVPTRLVATGGG